jgi:predicted RNA binding protein YcfA (HicA-like mRNA interferase family)
MKIPRDVSGDDLIKALARYGYAVTHQKGSHV